MKCLVSGSHGFIGEHLVSRLETEGHIVRRLSREELHSPRQVLTDFVPDHIFHLAAYGSHRQEKDMEQQFQVNVVDSFHLLTSSLDIPYSSLILVGSSSEYGTVNGQMCEDMKLRPNTLYAATKGAVTLLGRAISTEYKKPILTVRPFSVYGPGEGDHRFIPTLIRSCLTGEPMNLVPGANHDWIYVDDFVTGLILSCKIAGLMRGELHFGTGVQLSNMQVVKMVEGIIGQSVNVKEELPVNSTDSKNWVADIGLARAWGWEAKTSIGKGLQKTVDYYKAKYGV